MSHLAIRSNAPAIASTLAPMLNEASLTPESLLTYCQTRLRSVDDQVKTAFAEQRANAASSKRLGDLASWFKSNAGGGISSHAKDASDHQTRLTDAYKAIDSTMHDVKDNPKVYGELAAIRDTLKEGVGKGFTAEEVKAKFSERVASIQGEINSNSELQMISLQSMMSQRQTAVQLTTGLLQALNDQMKAIVGNVGR